MLFKFHGEILQHRNYEEILRNDSKNIMIYKALIESCSVKNMFLEISQNSQENTCTRISFLIKLQA